MHRFVILFVNCEKPANACAFGSRPQGQGMRQSPAVRPGRVIEDSFAVRQTSWDLSSQKSGLVKLVHLWIYSNLCIVDLSSTARHCTFRPARSSQKTSGQPRGRAAARQLSSSAAAVSRGRVEPRPGRRQGSSSRKIPAVASGRKIRQRQISRSRIRDGRKCGSFGWFCQRGRRERR